MGKVRQTILLLAILLFAVNAFAVYDWQPLQQNRLQSAITNYGQLGQREGGSSSYTYWWDYLQYVYGWGLWVGAITPDGDTLVTVGYNPYNSGYEFTPGAIVGGVAQDQTEAMVKIYNSTEPGWPLKKTNGQDSIISMCDTRCVYNDYLTTAHAVGGAPLNIEVTQMTYQWKWGVPNLEDVIYCVFEVKNTGSAPLNNVYLGPTADCDIASALDDWCYYDSTTQMAYQYQHDSTQGAGCVGISLLKGPVATKNYTFPDGRQVYSGDTLGVTHFKAGVDSAWLNTDIGQYKLLSGYNYLTGSYVPFDPKAVSGDQRFMVSTGPIDLAPGQTANVSVCIICANYDYAYFGINDTLAIKELRNKARLAKAVYENSSNTRISLLSPTAGAVLSGTQTISWTYGGNALSIDSVDIHISEDGHNWLGEIPNSPNTGSYSWPTTWGPDGVRYKIMAVLHGPNKLALSTSGQFTVNNTGNAAPEMEISYNTAPPISGNYNWKWDAGDADQDEILTSHYVMREGTGTWQKVVGNLSSSPQNTQLWQGYNYTWGTDTMINANYKLKTVCYDGQVITSDSTDYYPLYNARVQYPGTTFGHSSMLVNWYTYNPGLITGHSYEARFKGIVRGALSGTYYPADYKYDLWDVTSNSLCAADWIVPETYTSTFYYKDDVGQPYSGFAVLCGDTTFKPSMGVIDSLKRPATDPSIDTLNWLNITTPNMGWAKLNGNYEIRWHVANDTLRPEVWDVTYNTQLQYDSTILNNATIPAWNIGGSGTLLGRRYVTSTWPAAALSFMNVCGYRVYFNRNATTRLMTWATRPQEGDIWRIYSSGPIPPREGDVYSFTPTGVEGSPSEVNASALLLQQNSPNPFKQLTTINYQLAKPGLVNLKVYNIAGQLVKTLASGQAGAGFHSIKWDGRDNSGNKVSSGIYIYRLQAGNKDLTRKLLILR